MADGTFAVLMLVAGLTDMGLNHCGSETGCLGKSEQAPRLAFSVGQVVPRQADEALEAYVRYDPARKFGPFGQAIGLSLGESGETWLGYGLTYTLPFGDTPFYTELHTMPGLYLNNGGFDLGGPVEFRSGIEVGFENANGWRFAASYDHRSNAELYSENPGIETMGFRVSVPLR